MSDDEKTPLTHHEKNEDNENIAHANCKIDVNCNNEKLRKLELKLKTLEKENSEMRKNEQLYNEAVDRMSSTVDYASLTAIVGRMAKEIEQVQALLLSNPENDDDEEETDEDGSCSSFAPAHICDIRKPYVSISESLPKQPKKDITSVGYRVSGSTVRIPMTKEEISEGNKLFEKMWTYILKDRPQKVIEQVVESGLDWQAVNSEESGWNLCHLAAYLRNGASLIKLLAEKCPELINARDKDHDTPLQIACYWQNIDQIKALMSNVFDAEDEATDPHEKRIRRLLNNTNKRGETPIYNGAIRRNDIVMKLVSDTLQYETLYHCEIESEIEVLKSNENATYLCHKEWEEHNSFVNEIDLQINFHTCYEYVGKTGYNVYKGVNTRSSTSNILIEKEPKALINIMDFCVKETKIKRESADEDQFMKIIADYEPIEKFEFGKDQEEKDMANTDKGGPPISRDYSDTYRPLETIARKSPRDVDLLQHPLTDLLILSKWNQYGKYYFWVVTIPVYLLFAFSLLSYAYFQISPYSVDSNGTLLVSHLMSNCSAGQEGCYERKPGVIPGYIAFAMAIVRLSLEIIDMVFEIHSAKRIKLKRSSRFSKFMEGIRSYVSSADNIVELLLYSTAIFFASNVLYPDQLLTSLQWQVGVGTVFLVFCNMFLLMRLFPIVGLYCIMLAEICSTFITKIFLLLLFFLAAFTAVFHMTSAHVEAFASVWQVRAYLRNLARGVSGIDYGDLEEEAGMYSTTVIITFIVFAVLVQVLFINLTTSLAIEDVTTIRDAAQAEMNAVQIQQIHLAEKIIFHLEVIPFFRRILNKFVEVRRFQAWSTNDVPERVALKIKMIAEKKKQEKDKKKEKPKCCCCCVKC